MTLDLNKKGAKGAEGFFGASDVRTPDIGRRPVPGRVVVRTARSPVEEPAGRERMTAAIRDNPGQSRCETHNGRTPAGLLERGITGRKTASASPTDTAAGFTQAPAPARGSR
ncbi:hypothetical protein STXM2123_5121 [Streptomyces sp. F-3]|nr:hypothetical protein STXM2123_5121 [Streptomyces sp. F-3]